MVANAARRQLSKKLFPFGPDFGLARRVRSSRPASAHSLSALRLTLVLTHGILPAFRDRVDIIYRKLPQGQSRVY